MCFVNSGLIPVCLLAFSQAAFAHRRVTLTVRNNNELTPTFNRQVVR